MIKYLSLHSFKSSVEINQEQQSRSLMKQAVPGKELSRSVETLKLLEWRSFWSKQGVCSVAWLFDLLFYCLLHLFVCFCVLASFFALPSCLCDHNMIVYFLYAWLMIVCSFVCLELNRFHYIFFIFYNHI